ncbi:TetR/AcrR family transcriptional regulator [Lactiplantibacillus paraplantarum]|uniref:TetR/AcrR family transcriptional regulator n=1 Tax=Lactiplantibacillus paraplantarum TaxID=60520 RepID=UPI0023AA722F|nr:TetR/AcrR family transcriptional regulator [Lactiplantibacillus paraplantarum]WEE35434.1 TetR/AcrR family transcriptional regulator [Lactiplantibacillus paraplantarum]
MSLSQAQQRTRKLIITSLQNLLLTQPLDKITIATICKTAMIHHTTFYRYFADKYDLVGALLTNICVQIDELMINDINFSEALVSVLGHQRTLFRNLTSNNQSNAIYYDLITIMAHQLLLTSQKLRYTNDTIIEKLQHTSNQELASFGFAGMVVGIFIRWNTLEQSDQSLSEFLDKDSQTLLGF